MSKIKQIARICLDLCIFATVCFAEFAINRWFEPTQRGFFCNDESLAYPYRTSTITIKTLVIVVLTVPTLVILAVELFKRLEAAHETRTEEHSWHMRRRLIGCYKQLGCYLFGLALVLVTTEVGKFSTGRLRPHFFAVCQPQLPDGSDCSAAKNQGIYIVDYSCRGINSTSDMLRQLCQSFPSGHASIFSYAMLYAAIYLQAALTTRPSKLLKHLLQFVFVLIAWFVALSRIADYWHHWSDVLAGALLGTFIAILVAAFIADLFARKRSGSETKSLKPSKASTPTLPAYTFGSMPYVSTQYGQPYHNYGYVP